MAMKSTFLLVNALLLGLLCICKGCSPPEGGYKAPTLEYKMMNSDVVAYGIARRRHPDPTFPGNKVYAVDFEVRCIFKGAPLDEMIRIHHVGSVPGLCISTNMTEGQRYLIYLRNDGNGRFVPEYRQDPGDGQYVEEMTVLCEATVSYPIGYDDENNKEQCPEEYMYDDCVPKPVITSPAPEEPPTPPANGGEEPPLPPNDSTNKQPGSPNKETGAPYKPVVSSEDDDDDNSAMTLTSQLGVLICLVFSVFIL